MTENRIWRSFIEILEVSILLIGRTYDMTSLSSKNKSPKASGSLRHIMLKMLSTTLKTAPLFVQEFNQRDSKKPTKDINPMEI